MARTAEQVIKEMISNQAISIAQLTAEIERIAEENLKLVEENKKYKDDVSKLTGEIQDLLLTIDNKMLMSGAGVGVKNDK